MEKEREKPSVGRRERARAYCARINNNNNNNKE